MAEPIQKRKRKAIKKKARRKGLGKAAKVVALLALAVVLVMAVLWGVQSVQKQMMEGRITLIDVGAEMAGPSGTEPGQFKEPWALAPDTDGNMYVSDFGNGRIQKITPDGKVLEILGSAGDEKARKPGTFNQPTGMYVDPQGNLYVCDTFFHRIQKFDSKGHLLKVWEHGFFGPRGIAGDGKGRIYVCDTGNHKVQSFDQDGRFLSEWGGLGQKTGMFTEPVGVTVGSDGTVYVADTENRRIQKFTPDGKFTGAFTLVPWKGKCCEVPYLAFANGTLYTTNASENSVLAVDPASGRVRAIYRKKDHPKDGGFDFACGIAVDAQGRVWVTEKSVNKIAWFVPPAPKGVR